MSFEPDKATASVLIDGLSISCFDKSNYTWEVGYLRHPLHALILQIDDEPDTLVIARDTKVLRIEATNGVKPDYEKTFPEGFFDHEQVSDRRVDPLTIDLDQKRNFRWAMNLDEGSDIPHGEGALTPPPYPVTIAQISDAVFYTSRLSPDNLFLLPLSVDPRAFSTAALKQKVFGKAADEIGAAITCEVDGAITITADGETLRQFPHRPDNPWRINLKNMPSDHVHGGHHPIPHVPPPAPAAGTPELEQGDFQLYYESLTVTGEKQTFWGLKSPLASGRTDCNSGWVKKPDLAGLRT